MNTNSSFLNFHDSSDANRKNKSRKNQWLVVKYFFLCVAFLLRFILQLVSTWILNTFITHCGKTFFCELRNFVLRFRNWRKLVDLEKKMLLEFEFKICENGSSLKREYSLQKNPKNRRNPPQGLFTLHQQTKIQIRYFRTRKSSSKFHSCLKNPLHLKILCKSHWTW